MILPLLCWVLGMWVYPGKVYSSVMLIDGATGNNVLSGGATGQETLFDGVNGFVVQQGSVNVGSTLLNGVSVP